jgi:hypothetical protein
MRSSTDRRLPQRSGQRREAILGALDRWLPDCDLEAINVAEIAKEAGVTRSAFCFCPLTWAQLMDGAAAIWLSTIYGISWMPEWSQETA